MARVQMQRQKSTKQAIYFALKLLIDNEVVSKAGRTYFISRVWTNQIKRLFFPKNQKPIENAPVFALGDKQSISYSFPSLMACEHYWVHVFYEFLEFIPPTRPIFIWNPHEWFAIGRIREEQELFKSFQTLGKYAFFSIFGNTPLDVQFKEKWANRHVTIGIQSEVTFKENYYLNLFEDFILEVFIDHRLARAIDRFYCANHELSQQKIIAFEALLKQPFPVRMKISRHALKARKLRRKLANEFLIPKGLDVS